MSEWKKVKIGDICKIVKGTTGIASAEPGEYPLVVTAEERKTCSTYQFDCEAVCIPLVSSSGHGKKSLKNVHYQSGKFALGTILCAVIPNNPQELDARYLHQYLQFYKDIILVPLMKGAANVSLSMKDIATVEFPLPPIERQRELSNLFVSLQEKQKELSAEYEKQTEYAKLLRQNILQQAIEGKLTSDWHKQNQNEYAKNDLEANKEKSNSRLEFKYWENKNLPTGWCESTLGNLFYFAGRIGWKGLKAEEYKDEGPLFLSVYNLNNGDKVSFEKVHHITEERYDESPEIMLQNQDILLAKDGAGIGKVAYIEDLQEKATINSSLLLIRTGQMANYKFIYYFLLGPTLQKIVQERISGIATPHLFQKEIKQFVIPIPPKKEQEEIVKKVEMLLAKITTLENQIQERKSLSDKLIFGIIKENLEG